LVLKERLVLGVKNVPLDPLVEPRKIFLPPIHIKVRFMKTFVSALNKKEQEFRYIFQKFPRLSEVKIKVSVGPQVRNLLKD